MSFFRGLTVDGEQGYDQLVLEISHFTAFDYSSPCLLELYEDFV